MARDYELGLIINPDVGDEQARAIVDRVTQTVAAGDGQVMRVNAWGRRRLAYPIEHHRDGLYFFFDLILAPEAISEIERLLRVNEAVLRHLIKVRDPRVVEQQRQREAEAEVQAAAQAEVQAAAQAEAQAAAQAAGATVEAEPVPVAVAPAEAGVATETATPEEVEAPEDVQVPAESAGLSTSAAAQTSTVNAQDTAGQGEDEADEADTKAVSEAEANA